MSDYFVSVSGAVYAALASEVGATVRTASSSTLAATSGGTYTGTEKKNFVVELDATTTFKWSDDGGSNWDATGVTIATTAITLGEGVTVQFSAAAGAVGDQWKFWTGVTPVSGNEIATFEGDMAIEINGEMIEWRGQRLVVLDTYMSSLDVIARIATMAFKPETLESLWDITKTTSTTLTNSSETGTKYLVTWDTAPLTVELLFTGTRSDDGDTFEWVFYAVKNSIFPIALNKTRYTTHDLEFHPQADAAGNVFALFME